jgi:ribosome-associated protein
MVANRKNPTVKKAAKKSAVGKIPSKKAAVKKAAVNKSVVSKPVAKKKAISAAATPSAKKIAKRAVKQPAAKRIVPKKPLTKSAPAKKSTPLATASVPVSLKGLRGVSGAKAARIAQIVAESFLPKPGTTAVPDSRQATAPTPASEPGGALDIAHKAAAVLFSKKAEDVVLMDLRNLSTVADYYLIATCTNEPQMRSILGTVQRSLSRDGIKSLRAEYMPGVRWAVVDYGDLILHLFEKQTRGFYSLERLWADAPSKALKAGDYALPASGEADTEDDGDL